MADYLCLIVSTWDTEDGPARLESTGVLYYADDEPAAAKEQAERWAAENLQCPANAIHEAYI